MQTTVVLASPAKGITGGEISVTGPEGSKAFVVVNGEQAFSGRTFLSGGTISTTETSSATISLGRLGRVELAPASELALSFSENSIIGELSKGRIDISSTDGVSVSVKTADDMVTSDGSSPGRFSIGVPGGKTAVVVASGNVRSANGAVTAKQDDDDDDDDDAWYYAGAFGLGVLAGVIIMLIVDDEDDDVVSPVR